MRALQIYFGYLVTLAIIALPAYWNPHPSYPHPRFEWNTIWAALTLTSQPFAVGILCFYMIVLPFLPTAILDCHQRPRLVIAFSVALYVLVQINSQFNLRSTDGLWQFNPFAWQLLLMFGLIIGFRVRVKGNCIPKSRILTLAALLAVVFAILDRKGFSLLNSNGTTASFWGVNNSQLLDWLTAKTNLGLVRLLHALAVFYLVYRVLPTERGPWLNSIAKPFIVCGRNSLFVYCLGVVLAYFSHLVFAWTGITWLTVLIVPGNACLLQFAIANKWDRSRIRALSCQRKVRSNES